MATYQILYWDEIPIGAKATSGSRRGQVRKHLSDRFQAAADAVATATGRTDEHSYMAAWSWGDPITEPGGPNQVADRVIERIEAEFPQKRLSELRRSLIAAHRSEQHPT